MAIAAIAYAQDAVSWHYSAKKINAKKYELHITATIKAPWHIYSQHSPEGGGLPTAVRFSKNPLITFTGKPEEQGKMMTKYEEVFGVDVKYFSNRVNFVQVITLKNPVKTAVTGSIEFMACTNEQCMPPATVKFSIPLQ